MHIVVQIEDVGPPVLAAEGALRLGQSPPHRSTLRVDEQGGVEKDHKPVDGRHPRVPVEDGLEEVDEIKLLLVLLVLHELDGEQKSRNGEIGLNHRVSIDQDHGDQSVVVLEGRS